MIDDDLERLANRGPHRVPAEVIDSAIATAASPKRRVQSRFVVVSVVVVLVAGLVIVLASMRPTNDQVTTDPPVVTPVPAPIANTPTSTAPSVIATEIVCPAVEVNWPDRTDGPTMIAATIESGSIGGTILGYQLATDPYVFLTRGLSLEDAGDLTPEQQAETVPVTINGYDTEVRPPATGSGGQNVRFVFPATASPADPCNVWMINANTPMDVDQFVSLLDVVDMELLDEQRLQGEEIGFAAIGPRIDVAEPWPIGTIYTDREPQTLIIDFTPPNQECIAAQATATIGRGGAILISLSVDAERPDGSCASGADTNEIRIPLAEPIGERRVYTSTIPDTGGTSEGAELVADSIIGLPTSDAIDLIRRSGFEVRDNTDADEVESDFNPERIDIYIVDGVVDFADVG